jgi:signal transduction histidine kinase/ActR/RegA family two-component response regulator
VNKFSPDKINNSIDHRLGVIFKLSNAFNLLITSLGFSSVLLFYSYQSFTQELNAIASLVSATSRAALAFNDSATGNRVLSGLTAQRNIIYASLRLKDGSIISEYRPKKNLSNLEFSKSLDGLTNNNIQWHKSYVILRQNIELDGDLLGGVIIVSDLSSLYNQTLIFLFIGLFVTVVGMLGATRFRKILQKEVSQPIISLRDTAQKISISKDFSTRLSLSKNYDELESLIKNFNLMLEQLEDREKALLLAKDKAEQADKLKSIFLATVSHELRTPLHAIIGMTDELLCTHPNPEQHELLEIVRNSGKMLVSIINDILDFSKIEAGKLILNPSMIELESFIYKVLQMFESSFRKKGLKLITSIDHDIPKEIYIDGPRLAQVLVNLIGNALKFTASGAIDLSITKKEENQRTGKLLLQFNVKDTGKGIPQDALKTIFDSFTQVQRNGETTEGTGLGLAISSKLVGLMGGWIWAESEVDKGSIFSFIIETSLMSAESVKGNNNFAAAETQTISDQSLGSSGSFRTAEKPLILVVEDNKVNSKLAERILTKAGFKVILAFNGEEGIQAFLSNPDIKLILMDVSMPIMDGTTASAEIRKFEQAKNLRQTPIFALTAHATEDQSAACFDAGMNEFLTKPLDKSLLFNTISRYIKIPVAEIYNQKDL